MDAAANDTDSTVAPSAVSAVGLRRMGDSITASGQVRYAPASNYNGSDGFDYTVVDGAGATDTGHVTVTVTPGNDPLSPSPMRSRLPRTRRSRSYPPPTTRTSTVMRSRSPRSALPRRARPSSTQTAR